MNEEKKIWLEKIQDKNRVVLSVHIHYYNTS